MALSVILFLIAVWMLCVRRAITVALVGLQCFIVECQVQFSSYAGSEFRYRKGTLAEDYPAFSRLYVADFMGLVVIIIVVLGLVAIITGMLVISMLLNSRKSLRLRDMTSKGRAILLGVRENLRSSTPVAQARSHSRSTTVATRSLQTAQARPLEMNHHYHLHLITLVSTILLPLSLLASLGPIFWHSTLYHTYTSIEMSLWDKVKEFATHFVWDFFPRTACSITDLDQAVAAVAGATALRLSIYSVVKAYYKIWTVVGKRADTEMARNIPASFEQSRPEDHPRRQSF